MKEIGGFLGPTRTAPSSRPRCRVVSFACRHRCRRFGSAIHCIRHPPLNFAPTRQYRNALIAHSLYVKHDLSLSRQPLLEPPLTKLMAAGL